MCGIAGYIGKQIPNESMIAETLRLMRNRGPDHQGYVLFKDNSVNVALLHARLKIIDLDERSNQPFSIGDSTVIYNGEIYNYIELREKLEKKGIIFHTKSDTEVLLQYYINFGERCVDFFEGMWAFAVYDKNKKHLFISRDRFAEKPMFYCQSPDGFFFASEVKFLQELTGRKFDVNVSHIARYLVNGYKSLYKTEETFFKDIHEIPYSTNAVIDSRLKPKFYRYWQPQCEINENMKLEEAIEGVRQRLLESMRIRLRSDVPLAFCLSGGIDSASLTSIASKEFGYNVATFSIIDKDERYNEYDNIMATVNDLGCEHTLIEISPDNFFERLETLIGYHDSPLSTISYYVHSFLSEAISKSGYRVAVSGTAADELFTGYYDHFNLHLYEVQKQPDFDKYLNDWNRHISDIVRNPYLQNPKLYFKDPDIRKHIYLNNDLFAGCINIEFMEQFDETQYCSSLLRNRMMNELFHEAIPVILHEDDLNSMRYSVENRSPFLDLPLFEFAYSIPSRYLISNGFGKFILREAVKGILNEKVRQDRKKIGFNASINSLIDFNNQESRNYLLGESPVFDIVNKKKVSDMMRINPMPNSYSKFIFNFINTKIFLEKNR